MEMSDYEFRVYANMFLSRLYDLRAEYLKKEVNNMLWDLLLNLFIPIFLMIGLLLLLTGIIAGIIFWLKMDKEDKIDWFDRL